MQDRLPDIDYSKDFINIADAKKVIKFLVNRRIVTIAYMRHLLKHIPPYIRLTDSPKQISKRAHQAAASQLRHYNRECARVQAQGGDTTIIELPRTHRQIALQMRKEHKQSIEILALKLGLIRKNKEQYCSNAGIELYKQQLAATEEWSEKTALTLANDNSEEPFQVPMKEILKDSPRNPQNVINEMKVRLHGITRRMNDDDMSPLFIVLTTPSRFHASGKKWDGSTPTDSNRWLNKQWNRLNTNRAWRALNPQYFRVPEPHGDACTHGNWIIWVPSHLIEPKYDENGRREVNEDGRLVNYCPTVERLLRHYFLNADKPDEPGAAQHRIKIGAIHDAPDGLAAQDYQTAACLTYFEKYVSKFFEQDESGQITANMRVDAWRKTWGIRTFASGGRYKSYSRAWNTLRSVGFNLARAAAGADTDPREIAANTDRLGPILDAAPDAPRGQVRAAILAACANDWYEFSKIVDGRITLEHTTREKINEITGEITEEKGKIIGVSIELETGETEDYYWPVKDYIIAPLRTVRPAANDNFKGDPDKGSARVVPNVPRGRGTKGTKGQRGAPGAPQAPPRAPPGRGLEQDQADADDIE
jgi:hypothetical protein